MYIPSLHHIPENEPFSKKKIKMAGVYMRKEEKLIHNNTNISYKHKDFMRCVAAPMGI